MSLSIGTRLGPYEILSPLGAGGMGEVYRAKDTRLGREVAIKVLPTALSRDADRMRRFEKEARAASALTHPGAWRALGSRGSEWWRCRDLNTGPSGYEPRALTS
jgi:serine/threonine protein kinase